LFLNTVVSPSIAGEEEDKDRGGRSKSRITGHFFCDLGFLGFFGGNGLILSRENYPDRPFWLAKVGFDGRGEMRVCLLL